MAGVFQLGGGKVAREDFLGLPSSLVNLAKDGPLLLGRGFSIGWGWFVETDVAQELEKHTRADRLA